MPARPHDKAGLKGSSGFEANTTCEDGCFARLGDFARNASERASNSPWLFPTNNALTHGKPWPERSTRPTPTLPPQLRGQAGTLCRPNIQILGCDKAAGITPFTKPAAHNTECPKSQALPDMLRMV